jgi:hypothetical protein
MKQVLCGLSLVMAACSAARAQDESPKSPANRPASLGVPHASLGMPQPSKSPAPGLLPAQHTEFVQPAVVIPLVTAAGPVIASPYGQIDAPKPMPKTAEVKAESAAAPLVDPTPSGPITSAPMPSGPITSTPMVPTGDDAICPLPACAGPFVARDHFRLSAEYLMWWTSGVHAPPLVTTGPATSDGIIGQPGVATLAGDERVSPTFRSGARFGFEWFFGPRQVWGIDGHFFFLTTNTSNETFTSDQYPLLARPFFNVNQGIPFSEVVASPGLLTGAVNVHTSTSLWGADLNLRRNLYEGCAFNIDAFAGYRYLRLDDELSIQEYAAAVPGATLPATIPANFVNASAIDSFKTSNQFNGSQFGLNFECNKGNWVFTFRPSIAAGVTSSTLDVYGGQTSVFTNGIVSTPGGLLALNSNIGHYTHNSFAVVPEATFNIGYDVSRHCRLFVGYNMLWWSSVLRPGAQINPYLDVNRINGFPAANPITNTQPFVPLKDQSFFAQGLNFGLLFKW